MAYLTGRQAMSESIDTALSNYDNDLPISCPCAVTAVNSDGTINVKIPFTYYGDSNYIVKDVTIIGNNHISSLIKTGDEGFILTYRYQSNGVTNTQFNGSLFIPKGMALDKEFNMTFNDNISIKIDENTVNVQCGDSNIKMESSKITLNSLEIKV